MREVVLKSRPVGDVVSENFEVRTCTHDSLTSGSVLLGLLWVSVDPYLRGRMNDVRSYVPPFALGEPLASHCVAKVLESDAAGFEVGDLVVGVLPWREQQVASPHGLMKIPHDAALPVQLFLGALGMPGLTAYVGLLDVGALKGDDVVFVSGAAGAVGSIVGQLAKAKGATVIGSAGSDEKVAWLKEIGFDVAFSYRSAKVSSSLREASPSGIDLFFDNVGGEHFRAGVNALREHGRAVICGAISQYNLTEPDDGFPGLTATLIRKRLRIEGFIISDHVDRTMSFIDEVGEMVKDGRVRVEETVVEGFERLPDAFMGLFSGANTGKMLVKV